MAGTAVTIRDFSKEIPGELSADGLKWLFPQINSVNKHGRVTLWRIYVCAIPANSDDSGEADPKMLPLLPEYFANRGLPSVWGWTKVESRVGQGKIRDSVPTITSVGKNIGKVNETNAFCQALRAAYGLHTAHLRKAVDPETAKVPGVVTRYPPMLSQIYVPGKIDIFAGGATVYIQRKYNGVRAVAVLAGDTATDVFMYSRQKILYPGLAYMKKIVSPMLVAFREQYGGLLYLDGEIYLHGARLQDISGHVRNAANENDPVRCTYIVYDCFLANEDMIFSQRYDRAVSLFAAATPSPYVSLAPTTPCRDAKNMMIMYRQFLSEGYEGLMIRKDAPYEYSNNEYHSSVLLKLKPSLDAEFKIVGWETGRRGKAAKALMLLCETSAGVKFTVTPALDIPERIRLARLMDTLDTDGAIYFDSHWKGKMITVTYDEMSREGVPLRARTKMEVRVD